MDLRQIRKAAVPQPNNNPHARVNAFTRPDSRGMGTEIEVSLLLAAHARWLRPEVVVETGTYLADTTVVLQASLVENAAEGFPGQLISFDVDPDVVKKARARVPTAQIVLGTLQENVDRIPGPVDLAFVDSAYDARVADVATLAPLMAPLGLLFIHDARTVPMREIMRSLRSGWSVVEYPTPRGLAVLQRVKEESGG